MLQPPKTSFYENWADMIVFSAIFAALLVLALGINFI